MLRSEKTSLCMRVLVLFLEGSVFGNVVVSHNMGSVLLSLTLN
jgi:hypothetical protein